jgi:hypothetical protein
MDKQDMPFQQDWERIMMDSLSNNVYLEIIGANDQTQDFLPSRSSQLTCRLFPYAVQLQRAENGLYSVELQAMPSDIVIDQLVGRYGKEIQETGILSKISLSNEYTSDFDGIQLYTQEIADLQNLRGTKARSVKQMFLPALAVPVTHRPLLMAGLLECGVPDKSPEPDPAMEAGGFYRPMKLEHLIAAAKKNSCLPKVEEHWHSYRGV